MEVVQWPSLQTLYYRTVGVSVGQFYTGRKRREKAVNSSLEIRVSLLFFFYCRKISSSGWKYGLLIVN